MLGLYGERGAPPGEPCQCKKDKQTLQNHAQKLGATFASAMYASSHAVTGVLVHQRFSVLGTPRLRLGFTSGTPRAHVYLMYPLIAWATFCRITKDELPERLYSLSGNYL